MQTVIEMEAVITALISPNRILKAVAITTVRPIRRVATAENPN
jgi:hypothetical protein